MTPVTFRKNHHVNNDGRGRVYEWCRGERGLEAKAQYFKKGESHKQPVDSGRSSEKKHFFLVKGRMRLEIQYLTPYHLEEETEITMDSERYDFYAEKDSILLEYCEHAPLRENRPLPQRTAMQDLEMISEKPEGFAWCNQLSGMQVTFYYRNKGDPCGAHFHKGDDPSKNPERFLPLAGKMHFMAFDGKETAEFALQSKKELIIPPSIFHLLVIEEDSVFAEYRTTIFDRNHSDTYTQDKFESFLKEKDLPYSPKAMQEYLRKVEERRNNSLLLNKK